MFKKENTKYLALFFIITLVYGFVLAVVIVNANEWRLSKSQEYLSEAKIISNDTDKMLLFEQAAFLAPNEETYLNAGITALKLGNNVLAEKYLARVKTAEGYFQLANTYYNLEKYEIAASNYQKSVDKQKTASSYASLGKSFLKLGKVGEAKNAFENSYWIKTDKDIGSLLLLCTWETGGEGFLKGETDPANKAILTYNAFVELGYPQSAKKVLSIADEKGYLSRDSLIALANERFSEGNYQASYDYLVRAKTIDSYYPQIYKQLVIVCEKLGKSDEGKQYQEFLNAITF